MQGGLSSSQTWSNCEDVFIVHLTLSLVACFLIGYLEFPCPGSSKNLSLSLSLSLSVSVSFYPSYLTLSSFKAAIIHSFLGVCVCFSIFALSLLFNLNLSLFGSIGGWLYGSWWIVMFHPLLCFYWFFLFLRTLQNFEHHRQLGLNNLKKWARSFFHVDISPLSFSLLSVVDSFEAWQNIKNCNFECNIQV